MIYYVRHGQVNSNSKNLIIGRYDEELNEIGIKQAYETAEKLKSIKPDYIFCSPLKRASKTAQIINLKYNLPIIYDDRLIERDWQDYLFAPIDSVDRKSSWNYYANFEGAESVHNVFDRVYNFLDEMKQKYKNKNILIVSHSGIGRVTNCYFNGIPKDGDLLKMGLKNAEVAVYDFENIKENKIEEY